MRGGASQATVEQFRADLRARGAELFIEQLDRGALTDVLGGVRLKFGGEVTLEAPEARVSHRPFGPPLIRVPSARLVLRGDPLTSFSRLRGFLSDPVAGISLGDMSVDYRHRSVGHWDLDGVKRSAAEGSFTADQARFGSVRWPNPSFSVTAKDHALEVRVGGADATPRATAKYLSGDERAAEWIVTVPNQALGAFGGDTSRISGTLSWVVPSNPTLPPRGGFRFVMDQWQQPPWPEAKVLTGSSGAVAAVLLPAADGASLRLDRVEVAAALFTLEGSGSVTFSGEPELRFEAKGQRTCSELAEHLAPSRYRDQVRAKLEQGVEPGWVELELRAQVRLGEGGSSSFRWHLKPGCGLAELTP